MFFKTSFNIGLCSHLYLRDPSFLFPLRRKKKYLYEFINCTPYMPFLWTQPLELHVRLLYVHRVKKA
jgi:hypothetical protein